MFDRPGGPPQQPKVGLDFAVVLLTVLAPALGGTTKLWAQALVLLAMGTIILAAPPSIRLPTVIRYSLIGLVLLGLAGFLPYNWFPAFPWREQLVKQHGIELPGTLSPQPWLSLEILLGGFAGFVWCAYLLSRPRAMRRRGLIAIYCTGIATLALLAVIFFSTESVFSFWHAQSGFGFFPNRNQTGNVFALAAVVSLALAYEGFSDGRKAGFFWGAVCLLLGIALVLNYSRAGVGMFFVGSLMWLVWVGLTRRHRVRWTVGLAGLLCGMAVFFLFGGKTLDRFLPQPENEADNQINLRLQLQASGLPLLKTASWHGIGLGNFAPVFPAYRQDAVFYKRVAHPESDWLWLGIEMGWLAPLLIWGALGCFLVRHWPRPDQPSFELRAAAVVCVLLFVLHGFVDVSGHRLGAVLPALFLLSLIPARAGEGHARNETRMLYRALAILLIAVGGWWMASVFKLKVPMTTETLVKSREFVSLAFEQAVFGAVQPVADRALKWVPLDWHFYHSRGLARAKRDTDPRQAQADFDRALYLEPNVPRVPYDQGKSWLEMGEAELAVRAWQEALRRTPESERLRQFEQMLTEAQGDPAVIKALGRLAGDSLDRKLAFLTLADPQDFIAEVKQLLEADPDLKTLSREQKARLFSLWSKKGDRDLLETRLAENLEWLEAGWRTAAALAANRRDFQGACELAQRFSSSPKLPTVTTQRSLLDLRRDYLVNTGDFSVGYVLSESLTKGGQTDEAIQVLNKLVTLPNCPTYFHFLRAQLLAKNGVWNEAWTSWRVYAGL
jgi:tetratricopeptide (TPR) repeat protein/O-antigen ligase